MYIKNDWDTVLTDYFLSEHFENLRKFLHNEYNNYVVYPKKSDVFNCFKMTPLNKVKAVIIGQDPYHNENQAHGLCFSVKEGVRKPPSLVNIFKELKSDLGIVTGASGQLDKWAESGVLLLNAILTVRENEAGSHSKIGWAKFTDLVIKTISDRKENVVFILWGNFARSKKVLIDTKKHCVLQSAHPSPLSAFNGFFGSKPFSKTNDYLNSNGTSTIDWTL